MLEQSRARLVKYAGVTREIDHVVFPVAASSILNHVQRLGATLTNTFQLIQVCECQEVRGHVD